MSTGTGVGAAEQTAYYAVGMLAGRALSFLLLPVYTRFLSPADYGALQLVEMTLDLLATFAGIRLSAGIFRYYGLAESQSAQRRAIGTAFWMLGSLLGVAGISSFAAAPHLSQLVFRNQGWTRLIRLAAGALALQGFVTVPLLRLRAAGDARSYTWFSLARTLAQACLNVVFLAGLRMGPEGMALSNLVVSAVFAVVLSMAILRTHGLNFDLEYARRYFRYGVPLVATQVATFISTYADRYFIQGYRNSADVGLYALAYQFGFLVYNVGFMPFSMMWDAKRFEVARRPDRDAQSGDAFLIMSVMILAVASAVGVFAREALALLADAPYRAAWKLVPIVVAAYVIQGWATFLETGILVRERTEWIAYANWAAAAVALLGYEALVPAWGGFGAAVATVVAFSTRLAVTATVAQLLMPLRLPLRAAGALVGASVAAVMLGVALTALPVPTAVAWKAALLLAYAGVLWRVLPRTARHRVLGALSELGRLAGRPA